MMVSPALSRGARSARVLSTTAAGTMSQAALGATILLTKSSSDDAPTAPSATSALRLAGCLSHTTPLCAARVKIGVVGSAIGQAVDQPGIAVEGEDDRFVFGEKHIEILIAQTVGMFAGRLKAHEIHHVDDADLELRQVAPEQIHSSQRLH